MINGITTKVSPNSEELMNQPLTNEQLDSAMSDFTTKSLIIDAFKAAYNVHTLSALLHFMSPLNVANRPLIGLNSAHAFSDLEYIVIDSCVGSIRTMCKEAQKHKVRIMVNL